MAEQITLPELGENVEGGTVIEIFVSAGDRVKAGQPLLEVEAGKSTVEVPSPVDGNVVEALINKGDEVQTGQALFKIEAGTAAEKKEEKPPAAEKASQAAGQDGAPATREKAPAEKPAAQKEEPKRTEKQEEPKLATAIAPPPIQQVGPPLPEDRPARLVPASPATRLLARELGVDIALVKGSAKNGRVTPEDVKAYVRQLAAPSGRGPAVQAPRLPDFSKWGPIDTASLSTIRQETAKVMSLSWALVPHVTQHDEADITELDAFRKAQPADGPKITVTAFALKAVAIALQQFPQFNATLDVSKNQLILKQYYHIGVAVDTEHGLLVPVIRDVDKKSIHQLAAELTETAERARKRKITGDELTGGTFTITNLGGIGGTGFTPIVNYPEVAILGMSRGRLQPVIHNGEVAPRLMLPLSLSYDHRVIDGAAAARFTRRLAEMLENPLTMLLHA